VRCSNAPASPYAKAGIAPAYTPVCCYDHPFRSFPFEDSHMTRGVNKVILVGNLGADPETRYSASGTAMCTIRIATTDSWKDKQTGERQEKTEWHRV
jgi:hypothetical protein